MTKISILRTSTHLDYSSGSHFDSSSPDNNFMSPPPEPMSSSSLGLPVLERNLSNNDVLDSKGDQAYFLMHKEGYSAFANGAIVRIRNGGIRMG